MRNWLALYIAIFLSVVLLVMLFCAFPVPSHAGDVSLDVDVESANVGAVHTIIQSETIEPGVPMWFRDIGLVLEFAPGAGGHVTVTLVPTMPQNPPPGGAISRSWWITTTAPSYEVTATFVYSDTGRDVVLVLDQSGSMEFHTLCYGCWERVSGVDYPGGNLYPLPWAGAADWDAGDPNPPEHCEPTQYYSDDGYDYYFIEAEEYSCTNNSHDWDSYVTGYTYWVLQRTGPYGNTYASGRDSRGGEDGGAYIMHMPYPDMEESGPGVTCRYEEVASDVDPPDGLPDGKCWSGAPGGPYDAPRVDFNFAPVENRASGYYIWVRGQAMNTWSRSDGLDRRLFWGIDGVVGGSEGRSGNCGVGCVRDFRRGTGYGGATNNWEWRRLNDNGPIYWTQDVNRTLNIWAGGSEFALDRILITNDPHGYYSLEPLQANSGRGTQVWADGRTSWACDRCDARFAGYPDRVYELGDPSDVVSYFPICDTGPNPDRRIDDIYDDEQFIRGAVEAFKMSVTDLLDPAYDQVGYVSYSTNADIDSHLQCLRRLGDACNASVITDTVIDELETTYGGGSTNIADGMQEGLEVLRSGPKADCVNGTGPCGRPSATPMMVLLTDGIPNQRPNNYCDDEDLYPDQPDESDAVRRAKDCVMYYAYEARNQNVIVNTIVLGGAGDVELMEAVADLTGGVFRVADQANDLPVILEDLFEQDLTPPYISGGEDPYPYTPFSLWAIYHRNTPTGTWSLHPLTMTQVFAEGWAVAEGITSLSEWTVGYLPLQQVALEADPALLPADGVSTATLTATVTTVYTQPVPDGTVVTFATSLGFFSTTLGTVALPVDVITDTTVGGIAAATLTADVEPGQAVVTATAWGMTGTTVVEFVFPFHRVMLEAVPTALPADGTSTAILTATVTDIYGQPVQDGTVVTFATSLGSVSTISGSVSIPFGITGGGVVTAVLTAGLEPGRAVITATVGEAAGTAFVDFEPLSPHWVVVEAGPTVLPADGTSTSTIIAAITDVYSQPVQDGTVVTFAASMGSLSALTGTTDGGDVTVILTAGLEPGSAVVTATAGDVIGTAVVEFVPLQAYRVVVEAVPGVLPANGTSTATLTATVTDIYSHPVQAGTVVTFSTSLGLLSPAFGGTLGTVSLPLGTSAEGIVTALLTAGREPGWAVVTATVGGQIGVVQVQFVVSMYLPLVMRGF